MKPTIVLRSLNDLSPELLEPEPDQLAQTRAESNPADLRVPQRVPLHVQDWKHFRFEAYRHWGINE